MLSYVNSEPCLQADDCREQLKQCLKEARERLKQMTATEKVNLIT